MGGKIDKVKTIYKAFTEELPVDQEWFQKRMEICNSCEWNSKNIDPEKLATKHKVILKTICKGDEKMNCTACGCCLPQKPSQKSETCGLIELGKEPKWSALEVKIPKDKELITENLTPEIGSLKKFGNEIIYDLGESSDLKITFSLSMTRESGFDIITTQVGCKCTVAEPVELSKNSYRFDTSLSTKDFNSGANITRNLYVKYYGPKSKPIEAVIKIKLKKK